MAKKKKVKKSKDKKKAKAVTPEIRQLEKSVSTLTKDYVSAVKEAAKTLQVAVRILRVRLNKTGEMTWTLKAKKAA
jgi:hypothetical protein